MFDFFRSKKDKSNKDSRDQDKSNNRDIDVKRLRELILQAVKEELQQLDGGEGSHIAGIQLFAFPAEGEVFKYEAALYTASPGQLREELQRIADNYAIDLPADWKMEVTFVAALPPGAISLQGIPVAMRMTNAVMAAATVFSNPILLKVLHGKAENEEYIFEPNSKRINIGREKNVQLPDGSMRINTIAFFSDAHESNKYISRLHAHIEWNSKAAAFMLYADEGGVPPANKTKIRSAHDETLNKLNSTQAGYLLKAGDQIILGESALLEFQFKNH